jgi:ADP-ribosylglycohydrolase/fructose-1,6-bisphosphatase/inositol monophosphatase family enzyme
MADYREVLSAAIAAALQVGGLLRDNLAQPEQLRPAAEQMLRTSLHAVAPTFGYRSPEAGLLPGEDPAHLWLVDPLNGRTPGDQSPRGGAVSIALLHNATPVLGVVYAFAFPDHKGDLIAWAEGCDPITRNGIRVDEVLADVPLDMPAANFDDRLIVFLPPAADQRPDVSAARCKPARYITVPSLAYRLALVAAGDGIATVALDGPNGIDLAAAGHALLRGAGGVLVDQDGNPLRYSTDGTTACTSCFAGGTSAVEALRKRPWNDPAPPPSPEPAMPLIRPARYGPARVTHRVVSDSGVLSRAQGCLLGQIAGDALGGLVEFDEEDTIRKCYPHGCRDLADGGTWYNMAGQPTDDSELALLLARTLVSEGRYDTQAVLSAYVDWWNDPRTYDRGNTIGRALRAAAEGTTHEGRLMLMRMRANRDSESNGSLMRISPVGIFAAGRPGDAAEMARQDSQLTHPHPVCGDSCAVFVAAIATAIATGCGAEGAYQAALQCAEQFAVQSSVREALAAARDKPPADYLTQQGWVLIALQNAFFQLLQAANLEEGVVATVMAGGDTDTTAAIAGALLGAVHGRGAVPARWQRCVRACRMLEGTATHHPRAQEYWPTDVLELAECLVLAGNR